MGLAVDTQERGVVMTSSRGCMPMAVKARWIAVVPLLVATPYLAPQYSAKTCSNSSTLLPWVTQPVLIVSFTASISSFVMSGRAMGIFTSAPHSMD